MKKLQLTLAILSICFIQHLCAQDNMGVGTANPDPSAVLDLTAKDKGMLTPRMSTADRIAIANPARGLLVYDTDFDQFWFFDGVVWVQAIGPQGPAGPPGTNASLPSGIILMWSGTINTIPIGWALCDGNNGTPNLLDRFVISVPNASTNPGATGGNSSYTLVTNQMPAHTHVATGSTSTTGNHSHTGSTNTAGAHTHTMPGYHLSNNPGGSIPFYNWANPGNPAVNTNTTSSSGNHSHTLTTNTTGNHNHDINITTTPAGGNVAIDNRPAYYTLAFIMKL